MYKDLFQSIDEHTTVITVTRRLTTYLINAYEKYQQDLKNDAWPAVDILPLNDWLKRSWYENANTNNDDYYLLNANHEFALWQQIIRNSSVGKRLLQLNATTNMARQAWQLAKQWQLDIGANNFSQTEDTATWQQWAYTFQKYCDKNLWLDINSLPDHLAELIDNQTKNDLKKIILVGFDDINPQLNALINSLIKQGINIIFHKTKNQGAAIQGAKFSDTIAEIEHMAMWAKQLHNQQPKQTIGFIVPNLSEVYDDIINIFTDILAPTTHLPGHSNQLPFNISGTHNLAAYPIIQTAINLLKLYRNTEFSSVSAIIRSPFLGHAEKEMCARAKLDLELRQYTERFLSIRELLVAAKKHHCYHFAKHLEKFITLLPAEKLKYSPSKWALLFSEQLQALGWPGERSLNSNEYQLFERWQELLVEFSQFDLILGDITLEIAIQQLTQLALNTAYQPQSPTSIISILNPLEAAGLPFDHLWIMGLQEIAWPPPVNPNPFLPVDLQKKYQVPHATSDQALTFYRQLTKHLLQLSPNIIVSYPQHDEERSLRPSALIKDQVDFIDNANITNNYISLAEKIRLSGQLENYTDHFAPPLSEQEKITGGSAIFKYQAACPFRAFAQFRLGTRALAQPQDGLNARERGSILHKTLEIVWGILQDQRQLLTLADDELQKIIKEAIDTALLEFIKKRPLTFKDRFTQIEKLRLQKTITAWLTHEKQRPPFSVHAIEETYQTTIANIPLQIRVDRIDKLADGKYIIFDYKTGYSSINHWFSDRPDEPQLPLYISSTKLPIDGLAFATVRSNGVQFKGICAEDISINGITPIDKLSADLMCNDWNVLIASWRRVIVDIAEQFYNGNAQCNPKNGMQTCRYCDLHTFCRITEQP